MPGPLANAVFAFVTATTPPANLDAAVQSNIQKATGYKPNVTLVQGTTYSAGLNGANFAAFKTAAEGVAATTGCKLTSIQDGGVGRVRNATTGQITFGVQPATASFDCTK